MKQFTRVITRPEHHPENAWKLSLLCIHREVETGSSMAQGHGIFAATFVDLSNFTIVVTIIQFDHASQQDITDVHQLVTEFVESIQNQ